TSPTTSSRAGKATRCRGRSPTSTKPRPSARSPRCPRPTTRASSAGSSTGSRISSAPGAMAQRIRIAIAGPGGRMGQALVGCALDADDLELAAALDVAGASAIGKDAGLPLGRTTGVAVSDDVDAGLARADGLVDFTR